MTEQGLLMSNATQMAIAYRKKIEDDVRQDSIESALNGLLDFVESLAPSYRTQVINLCRRETAYRKTVMNGTADDSAINNIVELILKITSKAEAEAQLPSQAVITVSQPVVSPQTASGELDTLSQDVKQATDTGEKLQIAAPLDGELPVEEQQRIHWRKYNSLNAPKDTDVVRCEQITKNRGRDSFRLQSLSFSLRIGEITGIAGKNGSGKTTLLSLIRGYLAPDSGHVRLPTLTARGESLRHAREKIYYIRQDLVPWSGTLKSNLHLHAAANGFYGDANNDLVDELCFKYGLTDFYAHHYATLSGGYRLRYELIKALIARPKLLVLDEPFASLDVISRQELLINLRSIAYSLSSPTSIVLTTQNLYDLDAAADNIIILDNGRPVYVGTHTKDVRTADEKIFEIVCMSTKPVIVKAMASLQMELISSGIDCHIVKSYSKSSSTDDAISIYKALGDAVIGLRDITQSARKYFL